MEDFQFNHHSDIDKPITNYFSSSLFNESIVQENIQTNHLSIVDNYISYPEKIDYDNIHDHNPKGQNSLQGMNLAKLNQNQFDSEITLRNPYGNSNDDFRRREYSNNQKLSTIDENPYYKVMNNNNEKAKMNQDKNAMLNMNEIDYFLSTPSDEIPDFIGSMNRINQKDEKYNDYEINLSQNNPKTEDNIYWSQQQQQNFQKKKPDQISGSTLGSNSRQSYQPTSQLDKYAFACELQSTNPQNQLNYPNQSCSSNTQNSFNINGLLGHHSIAPAPSTQQYSLSSKINSNIITGQSSLYEAASERNKEKYDMQQGRISYIQRSPEKISSLNIKNQNLQTPEKLSNSSMIHNTIGIRQNILNYLPPYNNVSQMIFQQNIQPQKSMNRTTDLHHVLSPEVSNRNFSFSSDFINNQKTNACNNTIPCNNLPQSPRVIARYMNDRLKYQNNYKNSMIHNYFMNQNPISPQNFPQKLIQPSSKSVMNQNPYNMQNLNGHYETFPNYPFTTQESIMNSNHLDKFMAEQKQYGSQATATPNDDVDLLKNEDSGFSQSKRKKRKLNNTDEYNIKNEEISDDSSKMRKDRSLKQMYAVTPNSNSLKLKITKLSETVEIENEIPKGGNPLKRGRRLFSYFNESPLLKSEEINHLENYPLSSKLYSPPSTYLYRMQQQQQQQQQQKQQQQQEYHDEIPPFLRTKSSPSQYQSLYLQKTREFYPMHSLLDNTNNSNNKPSIPSFNFEDCSNPTVDSANNPIGNASIIDHPDYQPTQNYQTHNQNLNSVKKIGLLTLEERRKKIEKYLQKRKKRTWNKKISYDCRKKVADSRLRVKGRFVTKEQAVAILASDENATDLEKIPNGDIKNLLASKLSNGSNASNLKRENSSDKEQQQSDNDFNTNLAPDTQNKTKSHGKLKEEENSTSQIFSHDNLFMNNISVDNNISREFYEPEIEGQYMNGLTNFNFKLNDDDDDDVGNDMSKFGNDFFQEEKNDLDL